MSRHSSKASLYLKGVSAGAWAMGVDLLAGFTGLWLTTRILGKEEYGALAIAMAWMYFLNQFSTLGLDRTLLYRVSAFTRTPGRLVGGNIASTIAATVAVVGVGVGVVSACAAVLLGERFGFDPYWFVVLSCALPFVCLIEVAKTWQTANDRAHVAQLLAPCGTVVRVGILYATWLTEGGRTGVAAAQIAGFALALALYVAAIPKCSFGWFTRLSRGDYIYGMKLVLTRVAQEGILRVDVVMLGFLASAGGVAEYAVARRLAELAQIGNRWLAPVFTPRMRYAIKSGDFDGLAREYSQNRLVATGVAYCLIGGYFVLGEWLLHLFGAYTGAWPVLMILVSGYAMTQMFGATGRYLNMAGHASISLYSTIAVLLIDVILNYLTIPVWGAVGAAISTVIALAGLNSIMAWIIARIDQFKTIKFMTMWAILSMFVSSLVWTPLLGNSWQLAGIVALLSSALFLFSERRELRHFRSALTKLVAR